MKIVEQKGVTLIALIVTIAILIVLAGVGLNAAFKKDGMLKSAQNFSNNVQQNQIQKDEEANELIEGAEDAKNLAEEKK